MKIRINNIEFRKYTTTKTDTPLYEIVKYEPNPYYNKLQEYLSYGYEVNSDKVVSEKDRLSIDLSLFYIRETCFGIASLSCEEDRHELKSVGTRLLNLTKEEFDDFYEVYKLGYSKINKNGN